MIFPVTVANNLLYKNKRLRIKFGLSIVANYHEWEQINCPYDMIWGAPVLLIHPLHMKVSSLIWLIRCQLVSSIVCYP